MDETIGMTPERPDAPAVMPASTSLAGVRGGDAASPAVDMPLVGRGRRWQPLRGAARFDAALRTRPVARSEHFMLHHNVVDKLSTTCGEPPKRSVDDSYQCLGMVIAKRFARRAVTRVLIKRQVREAMQRHAAHLPAGDWVMRLRAPIDRTRFPSAASRALAVALRSELDPLFAKQIRRAVAPGAPGGVPAPDVHG